MEVSYKIDNMYSNTARILARILEYIMISSALYSLSLSFSLVRWYITRFHIYTRRRPYNERIDNASRMQFIGDN